MPDKILHILCSLVLLGAFAGCAASPVKRAPKIDAKVVGPEEMPPEVARKVQKGANVEKGTASAPASRPAAQSGEMSAEEKTLLESTQQIVMKRRQELAALATRPAPAATIAVAEPASKPAPASLPGAAQVVVKKPDSRPSQAAQKERAEPQLPKAVYAKEKAELWKVVEKTKDLVFLDTDGSFVLLYRIKHIGVQEVRYEYNVAVVQTLNKELKVTSLYTERIKPIEDLIKTQYLDIKKESITYIFERNMFFIRVFDQAKLNTILEVLGKLDSPPQQVHIKVVVAELRNTLDFQWGVETSIRRLNNEGDVFDRFTTVLHPSSYIDTLLAPVPAAGAANVPGFQGGVVHISNPHANDKTPFDFFIRALEDSGYADIESEPELLVRQGEAARVRAGTDVPIVQISGTLPYAVTTTVYKNVGVQLFVTPLVIGEESVVLSVYAEVSDVSSYVTGPLGSQLPQIRNRNTESTFEIGFNERLVIGGLKVESKLKSFNTVPIIGHIPILNLLVSGKESRDEYSTLYFFVEIDKPSSLPKEISLQTPAPQDEAGVKSDSALESLFGN